MKKAKVHSSSGDNFQRRVTKTVAVMVAVFAFSVSPMQLVQLYVLAISKIQYDALKTFYMYTYGLYISCYYVAAAAMLMYNNFFIYQRFNDTFKNSFKKLLGRLCKKFVASVGWVRDGSSDAASNKSLLNSVQLHESF